MKLRPVKPGCALAGVTAIVVCVVMAAMVELGWTTSWPDAIEDGWAFYALIGLVGGVVLLAIGMGLLNRNHLRDEPNLSEQQVNLRTSWAAFFGINALLIFVALGLHLLGIAWQRTFFAGQGLVLVAASTRYPRWLFATIRELNFLAPWDDRVVRVLLLGIGTLLILLVLFSS